MRYIIFKNGYPVNSYPHKPFQQLGLPADSQATDDDLARLDCYAFIDSDMPSFDCNLFYPIENWEIRGTECIRTWSLGEQDLTEAWAYLKSIRNEKLSACDWTMIPDADIDVIKKSEWLNYRQQLRDVPQNFDKPQNVVWPVKPS
jgi:hypothetical protein